MKLEQIIEKAKKRDKEAEKALFMKTHEHLMGTALRYMPDKNSAEDILQEAYIRIYQGLAKFQYLNDSATIGWMRRITATEAIRYIKGKNRWDRIFHETSTTVTKAENSLDTEEIYKALFELPDNQRIVFNLFAIEGYSHKEIAEKLGVAVSSSRALLTRARKKLQTKVQNLARHERA